MEKLNSPSGFQLLLL